MNDVVVLSVVLEEVKNKNLSTYNRLRAVIDNPLRHFFVFSNENHKYDSWNRNCTLAYAIQIHESYVLLLQRPENYIFWLWLWSYWPSLLHACRDTYVKSLANETPNDRNDRGMIFWTLFFHYRFWACMELEFVRVVRCVCWGFRSITNSWLNINL